MESVALQSEYLGGIHFAAPPQGGQSSNIVAQSNCPGAAAATGGLWEPCGGGWHVWGLDWSVAADAAGNPVVTLSWTVDGNIVKSVNSRQWWTSAPGSRGKAPLPN
jgi:hypothetical protein